MSHFLEPDLINLIDFRGQGLGFLLVFSVLPITLLIATVQSPFRLYNHNNFYQLKVRLAETWAVK